MKKTLFSAGAALIGTCAICVGTWAASSALGIVEPSRNFDGAIICLLLIHMIRKEV